jgi:hypothetical protein
MCRTLTWLHPAAHAATHGSGRFALCDNGGDVRRVALVLWLATAVAACGDDPPSGAAARDRAAKAIEYPATSAGLEDMMSALIDAVRAKRTDDVEAATARLELPDHARWFDATFGETVGARLSAEYEPVRGQFAQLARVIEGLIAANQTQMTVEKFTDEHDPAATGYQHLALAAMKRSTALYSVRLTGGDDDDGFHIWSFVHESGTFRWIGKLKAVREEAAAEPDLLELRVAAANAAEPAK